MAKKLPSDKVDRFTDLQVWRRSHQMFIAVAADLEKITASRIADKLIDQIIRSMGSIGANISEGFDRSKAKFLNSLDIALGEANETENWLYKLRDAGLLKREIANKHVAECVEIEKMLNGLMAAIRKRPDGRK
jgi:four helix bundle protein